MLISTPYAEQISRWPSSGRHILAQFDDETIIVYQAYRPSIGRFAVEHGRFGGEFSFSRMSWIKPNFLWMMYRSGWGTKEGQEVTLALRICRSFFDSLLAAAVPSSWDTDWFPVREDWAQAVENSLVRLQCDPDHNPLGDKLERRAIQLGLRGEILEAFGKREIIEVIDLSEFVAEQRAKLFTKSSDELLVPEERVYHPANSAALGHLRLD